MNFTGQAGNGEEKVSLYEEETVAAWEQVLILAGLDAVASAARTSKCLRRAAALAVERLQLDISGGQERNAIPCVSNRWEIHRFLTHELYI